MGRDRNANDDHDIKFAIRNESAMTTGIRSTRAASQASDSMGLFVNGQKVIEVKDAAVDFGGSTGGDTRLKNVEDGVANKDAINRGQLVGMVAEELGITFGYSGDGTNRTTVDYGSDTGAGSGNMAFVNHAVGLKIGDTISPLPSWCSAVNTTDHSFTIKSGTYHIRWEVFNYVKQLNTNGVRSGKISCGLATGTVNNSALGTGDPTNAITDMMGLKKTPSPFALSEEFDLGNLTNDRCLYTQSFTFGTYGDGSTHTVFPFVMYGFSGTGELEDAQFFLGSAHISREELTDWT